MCVFFFIIIEFSLSSFHYHKQLREAIARILKGENEITDRPEKRYRPLIQEINCSVNTESRTAITSFTDKRETNQRPQKIQPTPTTPPTTPSKTQDIQSHVTEELPSIYPAPLFRQETVYPGLLPELDSPAALQARLSDHSLSSMTNLPSSPRSRSSKSFRLSDPKDKPKSTESQDPKKSHFCENKRDSLQDSDFDAKFVEESENAENESPLRDTPETNSSMEQFLSELIKVMTSPARVHITHRFEDTSPSGVNKFHCQIFYAPQFHALRRAYGYAFSLSDYEMNRCDDRDHKLGQTDTNEVFELRWQEETWFLRSIARSTSWAAKGGKSGATFAKTLDERFIVKQIDRKELQMFLDFAPAYFAYMAKVMVYSPWPLGIHFQISPSLSLFFLFLSPSPFSLLFSLSLFLLTLLSFSLSPYSFSLSFLSFSSLFLSSFFSLFIFKYKII